MINKIIKRDGRIVNFDSFKIVNAVKKSFKDSFLEITEEEYIILLKDIEKKLEELNQEIPNVEQIQDIVEETLQERKYYRVAKN